MLLFKEKSPEISRSLEDYLETIAEIIAEKDHAHPKDIADHLGVTMPSVTNAMRALDKRKLVVYHAHCPIQLTASGAQRAAVIRHRHAALQRFFSNVLMLPDEDADRSACEIEHVIGEKALSRIVALAEAVEERSDCESFRQYLQSVMPSIEVDENIDTITLDELPVGRSGVVVKVDDNLKGGRKFADLGLVPGTLIRFEGHAPLGDLMRIRVMGSQLSMRASDARHIWLRLVR